LYEERDVREAQRLDEARQALAVSEVRIRADLRRLVGAPHPQVVHRDHAVASGHELADPEVELACAAIRGLSLDQALAPKSSKQLDSLIDALEDWLRRDP
jgi:hypothetical protein